MCVTPPEPHRAPGQDESLVVSLVQRHLKYTGSAVARRLLADWPAAKAAFVKVFPHEYRRAIAETADAKVRARQRFACVGFPG